MPRKKLSEFRAKTIVSQVVDIPYVGVEIHEKDAPKKIRGLSDKETYVIKVDQAIKGRFKKGLVKLDRSKQQLNRDIKDLSSKGFEYFLVEPYMEHEPAEELYFALNRTKDGIEVSYSPKGGIDVEAD